MSSGRNPADDLNEVLEDLFGWPATAAAPRLVDFFTALSMRVKNWGEGVLSVRRRIGEEAAGRHVGESTSASQVRYRRHRGGG